MLWSLSGEGDGRALVISPLSLLGLPVPAPPVNFSLGFAAQPPALRASWSPPPGGRDGFRLRLYSLGPLALKSEETLAPEAQNFSWALLSPGSKFLVQLATLRGPEESSSANATAWTRECPPCRPPLPLPFGLPFPAPVFPLPSGLPSLFFRFLPRTLRPQADWEELERSLTWESGDSVLAGAPPRASA